MKKTVLCILFIISTVILFAEPGSITMTNTENSTFYYILDPKLESKSANGDSFTSLDMTKFTSILSGSSVQILNLTPGPHNVFGFWGMPGTKEYSVWSLSFTIEDGQSKTFPLRHKNIIGVSTENTLTYREIRIDNMYDDWSGYPPLAAFSQYYEPKTFVRQTKNLIKEEIIYDSQFWGKGGTSIRTVKGFYGEKSFYLYFETSSRLSTGLSFLLYLYANRKQDLENLYTIEIAIDDATGDGKVLLWKRDVKEYAVVGTVKSSSFSAEAEIEIAKLPQIVQKYLFDYYSFDLKTNYFDESLGIHEEFYFTTSFFRDMISFNGVGK